MARAYYSTVFEQTADDEYDHWTAFDANSFATWLGSLRAHLAGRESVRR